jgi:hypothetical protein
VGENAGGNRRTGNNNIDLGSNVTGQTNEDNSIRIGNGQNATFIAGINGVTVASGIGVVLGTDGHLGRWFLHEISKMRSNRWTLKAHQKIEDQQKRIEALEGELKEQNALIRRVSAEVELQKSPMKAFANNQ